MSNLFRRKNKYLIKYSYLSDGVSIKSDAILDLKYSQINKEFIKKLLLSEALKESEQLRIKPNYPIEINEINEIIRIT